MTYLREIYGVAVVDDYILTSWPVEAIPVKCVCDALSLQNTNNWHTAQRAKQLLTDQYKTRRSHTVKYTTYSTRKYTHCTAINKS